MLFSNSNFQAYRSYRNVLINGDMWIAQAGAKQTGQGSSPFNPNVGGGAQDYKNVDMWRIRAAGIFPGLTFLCNDNQQDIHPLLDPVGGNMIGFCKEIEVTQAQVGVPADGTFFISQTLDSYAIAPLYNSVCVLSFQVYSPKAGQHYAAVVNNANSFVMPYTVNAANTWEYKTLSIIFNDTAANFAFSTNNTSIELIFPLLGGTNYQTANLNQWTVGNLKFCGSGQQNLLDTIGNKFRITDVQLEKGFTPTPYDRLPFNTTLNLCQEYYWQSFDYGDIPVNNYGALQGSPLRYWVTAAGAINTGMFVRFPVPLRLPSFLGSFSLYNPNPASAAPNWYNITLNANSGLFSVDSWDNQALRVKNTQVIGDAIGHQIAVHVALKNQPFPITF